MERKEVLGGTAQVKIKCGKIEYDLNENDEILYNSVCYQIITRGNASAPSISMIKAKKLIKEGKLIFKEKRDCGLSKELDIYMINE